MQRHSRGLILAIVIVSGLLTLLTTGARSQEVSCLVSTSSGAVQGLDSGTTCSYQGIPFAAPPVGNLRWKPPQSAAAWAPATLNATVAPPTCPIVNPPGSATTVGNEDCLKLNIWTPDPAPSTPAPVIVWIHTGAFQAASANLADSNARKFVERTGAIVVAGNYRLGPFGFMGHRALSEEIPGYPSSGNYGFLDQRAVLVWVRDHIAAFGGDPNNVTLAGQSAGAHSVSFHLVSPGSAGLFHRVILMSGFALSRQGTLTDAEALGDRLTTTVGCTNSDPALVLACLRSKSRSEVLLAFPNGQQEYAETPRVSWGPVVDGLDIPDQPRLFLESGAFNQVPMMIGTTRDEGWIYVDRSFPVGLTEEEYAIAVTMEFGAADTSAILSMYPSGRFASAKHALSQLTGDVEAACEARRMARSVQRTGTPVYLYSFEREADAVVPDLVIHGLDRNFVFGNNFGAPSNYVLNTDDLALFAAISNYWVRFATSGNPNVDQQDEPHWPRYRHPIGEGRGADKYLVLDWPPREEMRLREAACDFWEPFFLSSIANGPVPASPAAGGLCGTTVNEDLELERDLVCAGDGLTLGTDGLHLDLNGHTITGSGAGIGVNATGRTDVSITGGRIRNFATGVLTNASTAVLIERNTLVDNGDGVDLQAGSANVTIRHNEFHTNRSRGIMIRGASTNHDIATNSFMGNRVGILVFGGANNIITNNDVSDSILAGIRINFIATGNVIEKNNVTSNPTGIDFLPGGAAGGPIDNVVTKNTLTANACGMKGPTAGNTLDKNRFNENGSEMCQ
ncbi:MAG: carboxylesterase family protein [Vicinamibacterales bacterium]